MTRASGWTLAAMVLALTYLVVLWITAPAMGYTRDEGYYFKAAEAYAGWWDVLFSSRFWDAFDSDEINKHFSYNTEHPPLVKLSQGVTYHVLHRWFGVASPAQGFRAAGFLWGALSVFSTFLLGRRLVGEAAGFFAAAALTSVPRYFYDAHLACFDVAMTTMWALSLWAFHRAWRAPPDRLLGRSIVAGLVFGLALATKLNALFLPFIFVGVWLINPPDPIWPRIARGPGGGLDVLLPMVPIPIVACGLIGPLVFVGIWPHLWYNTFERIAAYIRFHLRHEHYPISYFHELLVEPPFPISFPFVMSGITIPGPLLLLGVVGTVAAGWGCFRRRNHVDALLLMATVLPVVLIALPSSPIFGGVKHWYNAMPTFLIAGGAVLVSGLAQFGTWIPTERLRRGVAVVVISVVVTPGVLGLAATHPYGIGFYNALAGGFRGGAELGMQRGFWGGLAFETFEVLPQRQRVFFNRTNYESYKMYRREGLLPHGTIYANSPRNAGAGIVFDQPEHGEAEAEIWTHLGTRPVAGTYQDGVTLTQIYVRGRSNGPPPGVEKAGR